MWRVLAWNGHHRIRDVSGDPDALTDLDGAFRIAQLLRDMRWPWSISMGSGAPSGEGLVRWQAISQGVQFGSIYLFTRVAPAVFSVNLFITIGWIFTGVAVYLLGRRLSLSPWLALGSAVLAQMLPALPKMAANYTTYVFIGVPVYVVCRAIDAATEPNARNFLWLAGVLGIACFFDPYWFLFSIAMVMLVLVLNARTVWAWLQAGPRWARLLALSIVLMPLLLVVALLGLASARSGESLSRPVSIESKQFVNASLRPPSHWFHSGTEGVGLVVGILGLAAVAWSLWRRSDRRITCAAAVVVLMMLLSTRTRLETPWFTIGSGAEFARFVMPGVRFFGRASLVAEAMLCVFAVMAVVAVQARARVWLEGAARRNWLVVGATAILVVVAVLPLAPYRREVNDRWDDFAAMRQVLAETESPVVLAVPFERHGRDWLELSMLDGVPAVNQLYVKTREDLTAMAASRGPQALAQYLASLGTTHLLAIQGANRYPTTYELTEPWFVERANLELDSYGDPREDVVLYEVRAEPIAVEQCFDRCRVGTGFDFVDGINVLREPDATREQGLTGEVIAQPRGWWMLDDAIEMQFSLRQLATVRYIARMGIEVTNPCADERTVMVERLGVTDTVVLGPEDSATLEFDIASDRATDPVVLSTDGSPCDGNQPEPVTLKVGRPELVAPV
jgi:hypothetical protein